MNKFLILCCINIISLINAAPTKSDANINEILQQLDFLNKCPAVLNNNIEKHKSNGGLSHCKTVSIGIPPNKIDLPNWNEFYCIGLLVADIQLCSGNKTNKIPKNYEDLKSNIDKIQSEKPDKICNELKQLKLFNETANVTNLKQWIELLDKNLHDPMCVTVCRDVDNGNTNLLCSMIYYVNNITHVTIPEKKEIITPLPKVTTNKDKAQQNAAMTTTKQVSLNVPVITNAQEKIKTTKAETLIVPAITSANIKDNAPSLEPKVEVVKPSKPVEIKNAQADTIVPTPEKNQPEAAVDKTQKQTPATVIEETTVIIPKNKEEPVGQVKTVEITEGSKQSPVVNQIPVVEETQKNPINIESSSVSSTVSGVREDLADDYFEEMEDINKENEDQLLPQTNARKETIEILTNDQDRHRMPSEEDEEMEDSNFFSYFMFVSVMFIAGYVVYHNKQKIMALLLEGRKDRNSRRRPNTASYRKLNSNLEEAVTSKCSGSASHVIY